MLIIRETFTCRPGMASKLAKMIREVSKTVPGVRSRVMTDLVGSFNTVVWENEAADLGEFEKRMREYESRPEIGKMMAGYTDMYVSGHREIFRVLD